MVYYTTENRQCIPFSNFAFCFGNSRKDELSSESWDGLVEVTSGKCISVSSIFAWFIATPSWKKETKITFSITLLKYFYWDMTDMHNSLKQIIHVRLPKLEPLNWIAVIFSFWITTSLKRSIFFRRELASFSVWNEKW